MEQTEGKLNSLSLDSICAALAYAMGIPAPREVAAPSKKLTDYVDKSFGGEKADRIFLYNPDAIGEWIFRNIPQIPGLFIRGHNPYGA